jgi:hypothetical protein
VESAALNTGWPAPPEKLDRIVRLLVPPAAREAVVGDMWETYRNPMQYAREALCIVPHVVFSQMRRHLNLPALIVQAMVLYACLGAVTAGLLLPVLMVAGAYQTIRRPTPRRAMREALAVAFALMVILQVTWTTFHDHQPLTIDGIWLGIDLFFIGPCLTPLLCLLRAGLIVRGDRRPGLTSRGWTAESLAHSRAQYLARLRGPQFLEAALLGGAAILSWHYLGDRIALGHILALLYVVAALFLVLNTSAPGIHDDFVSLRAAYQHDLVRHQLMRRFLWWLWCAPALVGLHADAVHTAGTGDLVGATMRGIAAIMLCFFVTAMNREEAGWTQEQIGQLDRMREAA